MAATRRPNVIRHEANGDETTEHVQVYSLTWSPKDTTSGGTLIITDSDDNHLLHVYSNTAAGGSYEKTITIYWPFGFEHVLVNGLKTFVIPAGFVEYVLA